MSAIPLAHGQGRALEGVLLKGAGMKLPRVVVLAIVARFEKHLPGNSIRPDQPSKP